MRSRAALACLVVVLCLAACASSSHPDPVFKTVLVNEGTVISVVTPGSQQVFATTQPKMWAALAAAYGTLGLPLDINDPANHRMGISSFYQSGQMNGQPMSHFVDCGNGPTGPLANTRRVYFSMETTVTVVDSAHTALLTEVSPTAVDMTGATADRISCGSTGALEGLLYDAVVHQLASK